MEKPEAIREKIELLKKKLEESENYHSRYQPIEELDSDEKIGQFKIGRAKRILKLLNDGSVLIFGHQSYGEYEVYMSTKRNMILVKYLGNHEPSIDEDTIMDFIVWGDGKWLIDTKYNKTNESNRK